MRPSIDIMPAGIVFAAASFAFLFGFFAFRFLSYRRRSKAHKKSLMRVQNAEPRFHNGSGSLSDRVISYMESVTRQFSVKGALRLSPKVEIKSSVFEKRLRLAGLEEDVSHEAFTECEFRLALLCLVLGLMAGLLFSWMLAVMLAAAGAAFGWSLPSRALKERTKSRVSETERHLPEMLDVVALGMRSGLSFDSSLKLYAEHFDTMLSRELANGQKQWSSGLARRDETLRKIASTYDSIVFSRVIETIIRSIRYGSSMVQSLERDAAEARSAYQSQKEEQVAKAPVKMMIPTGTLILPAMLIMVLGPVLLELMGGGF